MSSHYEVFMVVILPVRVDRSHRQAEDLTIVPFTYLPYQIVVRHELALRYTPLMRGTECISPSLVTHHSVL